MNFFDFTGLRLDIAFRYGFGLLGVKSIMLIETLGDCAPNSISKRKPSKSIAFWKLSVDGIGSATLVEFMVAPVSDLGAFH